MSADYRPNEACRCARCVANRVMGPAVLVTLGVLFLLSQFHYVGFGRTWPVLLIVIGAVLLAQRNAPLEGHVQAGQARARLDTTRSDGGQVGNG
jgi:hypothetical protein